MKTILITHRSLDRFEGSEKETLETAEALISLGCRVKIFSPVTGAICKYLPCGFHNRIEDIGSFDYTIVQHNIIDKHLIRKSKSNIYRCHSHYTPEERPSEWWNYPISAITTEVADFLRTINRTRVSITPHLVNLKRYKCKRKLRRNPKVCIFSNRVTKDIGFPVIGIKSVKERFDIHTHLEDYDVVVGAGRSAIEAMSMGKVVIAGSQRFGIDGTIRLNN